MRSVAMGLLLAVCAACIHDDRPSRERGAAALFDRAQEVKAPPTDRCQAHGSSAARQSCDEARYLAQLYARRLSTGDAVCLEGGFGDPPSAGCLARAAVVDTRTGAALIEIRDARPGSRWFDRVQNQIWFEEGALVDLYLAERGY